jgi:hypothetical protein
MAGFKLRRGRVDEAAADAALIRADAASNGAASDPTIVDALVICARAALIKGDEASALSFAREIESRAAGLPAGEALSQLWRRLVLLYVLLRRHEDVVRAAGEARRLAREVWPEVEWLEAEISLREAVSAVAAKAPLAAGVTVWRLGEWLSVLRSKTSALNDPLLAEEEIRAAAAAETMGEPDLAISLLQSATDAIDKSCGETHPDLRAAEQSLARLLACSGRAS